MLVMMDGTPINHVGITKAFHAQQHMDILEHLAESLNLNPIRHV